MAELNLEHLRPLQAELDGHPIYAALQTLADLRVFMAHHVFSVWDFMSLVKYLQGHIAPTTVPWMPQGDPNLRFFINQLVLEEESDQVPHPEGPRYASHFESYLDAMTEVGADTDPPRRFLGLVRAQGLDAALYSDLVPLPARYFCETTFCFIRQDKPHAVAAAFALGRERIIPAMFRRLLARVELGTDRAPGFHYYLERHIHLDGDFHGPLSLELLKALCGGDPVRIDEAQTAAEEALCARIRLWDGVLAAIETARGTSAA
jgi:hypothetical protein